MPTLAPRLILAALALLSPLAAETVTLNPVADATLYETTEETANSTGFHLLAGNTNGVGVRRALLRFDLSGIPDGAVIESASMALRMNRSAIAGDETFTLHRVETAWGEGPTAAQGNEGIGDPAEAGDPTWSFSVFDSAFWDTAGGDFVEAASAQLSIANSVATYTFTGSGLGADVQQWLDGTAPNHGWILIGNEVDSGTAKRFDSREGATPPVLTVTYATETPDVEGTSWIFY